LHFFFASRFRPPKTPVSPRRKNPNWAWPHDFGATIACVSSVATDKAAILRTITPKSRLVRWLSANSSH
jgi:hypothetical protein